MTKAEIVNRINQRTGIEKVAVSVAVESLMETIKENIRKIAIEQFQVFGPDGKIDQKATDQAASQALNDGEIHITRALFEQVRASLPPSSKADIRAELEAFEAKVKGLVN